MTEFSPPRPYISEIAIAVVHSFGWRIVFCFRNMPESVSQSWVSSDGSVVRLMATSSKRACAIPRSAAPRAPARVAGHCWPVPPQEILKHSSGSVSVGSWCPQGLSEPSEHLWQVWGLILNAILPLLLSFWGFSFALGRGVSFFDGI